MVDDLPFHLWLAETARQAGYDIDSPRGDRSRLAKDADMSSGQLSRTLAGQSIPSIENQRGLARALRIPLRTMLVRSGAVEESELPGPDDPPRAVAPVDLFQVAAELGIPPEKRALFAGLVGDTATRLAETDTDGENGPTLNGRDRGSRATEG